MPGEGRRDEGGEKIRKKNTRIHKDKRRRIDVESREKNDRGVLWINLPPSIFLAIPLSFTLLLSSASLNSISLILPLPPIYLLSLFFHRLSPFSLRDHSLSLSLSHAFFHASPLLRPPLHRLFYCSLSIPSYSRLFLFPYLPISLILSLSSTLFLHYPLPTSLSSIFQSPPPLILPH